MSDLINKYPYTDLHSVNLDYILKVVRENAGLHLEVSGNQLLMKTADNTIISAITIPYATEAGSANTANSSAYASTAGSASSAAYASTAGSAATAANATEAAHAATADNATSATSATSADYATTAGTAAEATHAASADYATTTGNVEKAGNGIKSVAINDFGNLVITLEDNTVLTDSVKYAIKAQNDSLNNNISRTYFASVIDDNGTLKFEDAHGTVIASITPSSQIADQDSYGNTIADYIKTIATAAGSNYVTITHGNGTVDTILIPYSDAAWKDTNGNVIKNSYIKRLEIVTDPNDGQKKLVAYNGDTPEAELFRIPVEAYHAQEADHADVADEADHALAADNATFANVATLANKSVDSAYFIDCYDNHDGAYSVSSPNTITIERVYDNNGNEISLSDITADNYHNVYFRYRPDENSTDIYTYTVDTSYKIGSPVFFKARIIDSIQVSNGLVEIEYKNIEVGILNGAVATSKLFIYTDVIGSSIVEVEIKATDTDPLNLTVGQDSDYETDLDFGDIINLLSKGMLVSLKFIDDDSYWQKTAVVNGSGSPAVIMLYETGTGPAWFKLGNNSTYTDGINLERLS